jgi:hypothetical protein
VEKRATCKKRHPIVTCLHKFLFNLSFFPPRFLSHYEMRDDVAYPKKMCVTKMKGGDFGFFMDFNWPYQNDADINISFNNVFYLSRSNCVRIVKFYCCWKKKQIYFLFVRAWKIGLFCKNFILHAFKYSSAKKVFYARERKQKRHKNNWW